MKKELYVKLLKKIKEVYNEQSYCDDPTKCNFVGIEDLPHLVSVKDEDMEKILSLPITDDFECNDYNYRNTLSFNATINTVSNIMYTSKASDKSKNCAISFILYNRSMIGCDIAEIGVELGHDDGDSPRSENFVEQYFEYASRSGIASAAGCLPTYLLAYTSSWLRKLTEEEHQKFIEFLISKPVMEAAKTSEFIESELNCYIDSKLNYDINDRGLEEPPEKYTLALLNKLYDGIYYYDRIKRSIKEKKNVPITEIFNDARVQITSGVQTTNEALDQVIAIIESQEYDDLNYDRTLVHIITRQR